MEWYTGYRGLQKSVFQFNQVFREHLPVNELRFWKDSQSPDFHLFQMLWQELKRAVRSKNPQNPQEQKKRCKEEQARMWEADEF